MNPNELGMFGHELVRELQRLDCLNSRVLVYVGEAQLEAMRQNEFMFLTVRSVVDHGGHVGVEIGQPIEIWSSEAHTVDRQAKVKPEKREARRRRARAKWLRSARA